MVRKGKRAGKRGSEKEREQKGRHNSQRSGEGVELLQLSPSKLAHTNVRIG